MSNTCKPFVLTTVESLKRREELSLYRKRKAISGNRQMSKYVPEKLYSRIMSLLSDTELLESVLDHYSSIQPHPPIVKSGNRDSRTANKFFYAGKFAPLEDSLKKSSENVYKDLRDGDLYPGVEYSTALISPIERNPNSSKSNSFTSPYSNSADGYQYLRPLLKRDGGPNVLKPGINTVCDTRDLN
uniref:Uncharacterized protein n=1 Tax=Pyropia pulchra TaxID=60925 RepID=O24670_9RHOD|nr:ORF3 [Pyropia pulchra]